MRTRTSSHVSIRSGYAVCATMLWVLTACGGSTRAGTHESLEPGNETDASYRDGGAHAPSDLPSEPKLPRLDAAVGDDAEAMIDSPGDGSAERIDGSAEPVDASAHPVEDAQVVTGDAALDGNLVRAVLLSPANAEEFYAGESVSFRGACEGEGKDIEARFEIRALGGDQVLNIQGSEFVQRLSREGTYRVHFSCADKQQRDEVEREFVMHPAPHVAFLTDTSREQNFHALHAVGLDGYVRRLSPELPNPTGSSDVAPEGGVAAKVMRVPNKRSLMFVLLPSVGAVGGLYEADLAAQTLVHHHDGAGRSALVRDYLISPDGAKVVFETVEGLWAKKLTGGLSDDVTAIRQRTPEEMQTEWLRFRFWESSSRGVFMVVDHDDSLRWLDYARDKLYSLAAPSGTYLATRAGPDAGQHGLVAVWDSEGKTARAVPIRFDDDSGPSLVASQSFTAQRFRVINERYMAYQDGSPKLLDLLTGESKVVTADVPELIESLFSERGVSSDTYTLREVKKKLVLIDLENARVLKQVERESIEPRIGPYPSVVVANDDLSQVVLRGPSGVLVFNPFTDEKRMVFGRATDDWWPSAPSRRMKWFAFEAPEGTQIVPVDGSAPAMGLNESVISGAFDRTERYFVGLASRGDGYALLIWNLAHVEHPVEVEVEGLFRGSVPTWVD